MWLSRRVCSRSSSRPLPASPELLLKLLLMSLHCVHVHMGINKDTRRRHLNLHFQMEIKRELIQTQYQFKKQKTFQDLKFPVKGSVSV
ncbi:hypothetical protein R3I93_020151 [Phoxinus phoxinus]|uniref:Uncharacterized protein n=1 Tax=Phoxinus phoxinus TaxID=58324 RepID=A0AAN9C817_9TELE